MSLPPPQTFEQGQRYGYGLAVGIAGIAFGLAVLVAAFVVVFAHWKPELQATQLYILAGLAAAGCLNTTIIIVGLLVGGPVGKLNAKVSDGTRTAEIDAEGHQ
jgi:hypothetical protein